MPQVPTYGDRQLRTEALRPAMAQNTDVSSGARAVGQGLMNLSEPLDLIAKREAQTKASEVEATITTEWLKWDTGPEGRAKYRGQNADGYAPAAEAWWKSAADTYGKDLDMRARAIASRSLSAKQQAAMGNVLTFQGAEKERHADDTYSADVNTTIQFGVTSGDVAGAAQQVREKAAMLGARKGWTTEQVQAETGKNLSALHLAQITKLAEFDASKAQEYYDKNKAEVGFAQQARVEQVLKGEVDNQFATQKAAEWAGKPLSEQLAEAAKITDPQRREKTLTQVRNNYALVKQAEQEREGAAADQAWQLVGQGKRVPEAILSSMGGRERVQLQEHLRAKSERLAAGKPIKTDMATYIDVREKLAAGERVDLRALTEKVSPSDMEKLIDIQTAASKGGVKQDTVLTDETRIGGALRGLGIDKKKNPDAAFAFTSEVDRRVRAESAARGGKDLTADEKQKIIDSVAMDKVYVDEWGRDPNTPLATLTPEQMGNAYVNVGGKQVMLNSIPATDRAQIMASLKKRGLPTTEQAVAEIYMMKKGK